MKKTAVFDTGQVMVDVEWKVLNEGGRTSEEKHPINTCAKQVTIKRKN